MGRKGATTGAMCAGIFNGISLSSASVVLLRGAPVEVTSTAVGAVMVCREVVEYLLNTTRDILDYDLLSQKAERNNNKQKVS